MSGGRGCVPRRDAADREAEVRRTASLQPTRGEPVEPDGCCVPVGGGRGGRRKPSSDYPQQQPPQGGRPGAVHDVNLTIVEPRTAGCKPTRAERAGADGCCVPSATARDVERARLGSPKAGRPGALASLPASDKRGVSVLSPAPQQNPQQQPAPRGSPLDVLGDLALFLFSPRRSVEVVLPQVMLGSRRESDRERDSGRDSGDRDETRAGGAGMTRVNSGNGAGEKGGKRSHSVTALDPYALPHLIDERVDVCYGESVEHIKMRHRLREQLREEGVYKAWLDNNHAIMRFMRARQFNYDKVLVMLRNCLQWRVEANVDAMLSVWKFTERLEVKRHYPYTHHRTDKFGRVLYIERIGVIDFEKLSAVTTRARLLESFVYDAELTATRRLPGAARVAGHPVDKIFTLLDLDGFRLSMFDQNARDYLKAVSQMASDYYPEQLGAMFIVNAPVGFRVVWSFIKPLLDIKTQQKIRIFANSGYQQELLQFVSAENLPTMYGGKDETCDFQTERGPWVDEEWVRRFT